MSIHFACPKCNLKFNAKAGSVSLIGGEDRRRMDVVSASAGHQRYLAGREAVG
ncbi:MAG: hypothetical protein NZM31_08840 [Gemmatales bacterium]|nr:hypothetical protein [Gemmatales bacterium]MDW8387099.1 hypothetical protein [Gemmatales bacterium]